MAHEILTADRLLELLAYEPGTGEFRWLVRSARCIRPGDLAGTVHVRGYRLVSIDGRKYRAHRLVWLYVRGEWPAQDIDHLNGDRADNRIENLRDVDKTVNMQNQRAASKNSATGLLGVAPSGKKWRAQIRVDGRVRYLGTHATPELASLAYLTAKRLLHPGCTI